MNRTAKVTAVVVCIVVAFGWALRTSRQLVDQTRNVSSDSITVHLPFVFSKEIDPRDIVTVGDQVACEHLFAFHSRESIHEGFGSVVSNVQFDRAKNSVTILPKYPVVASDGTRFDLVRQCKALRMSLNGTSHAPIGPLVKQVVCDDHTIQVQFSKIPINFSYLFTLADFSIYDPNTLPFSQNRRPVTTGPYRLESMSESEVQLTRNGAYPSDLTANSIKRVTLKSYPAQGTNELIRFADPTTTQLVYLYGYALNQADISALKEKGYRIRQMPSEWLLYWGINEKVSKSDRERLFTFFDSLRERLLKEAPLGQAAFSLSPSDRPFGIKEEVYRRFNSKPNDLKAVHLSRKIVLYTLDEWAGLPIFAEAIRQIQSLSNQIDVKYVSRKDAHRLWSGEFDVILSPLGISPGDPINNFAFKREFSKIATKDVIVELSAMSDPEAFNRRLIEIEKEVLAQRLWAPIGHFPGVVIEAPGYERDEKIAWSWGIQAWTYRVSPPQ